MSCLSRTGCSRGTTSNPLANKPDAIEFATLIQNQDALLNQEVACRGFAYCTGCETYAPRNHDQPEWTNHWTLLPTAELPIADPEPSTFYAQRTFVRMRSDVLSEEQNTREMALANSGLPQGVIVRGALVQEPDGFRYLKAALIQPINSDTK